MPLTIIRQDLTRMHVDAIVNAANTRLLQGGGVCGAIFAAAGEEAMQGACQKLSPITTGAAVITPGFALKARHVIHAAGPVYDEKAPEQSERLLYKTYQSALHLAREHRLSSIAFPLISSGIYGYPKEEALRIALSAMRDFLKDHEMDIWLTVFSNEAFAVSQQMLQGVKSYISEHYVKELDDQFGRSRREMSEPLDDLSADLDYSSALPSFSHAPLEDKAPAQAQSPIVHHKMRSLDKLFFPVDEPFSDTLLRLIDQKGLNDVTVYKRANLDRKLFSKIRNAQKGYQPSKRTVLALIVGLQLSPKEADDLLRCAGFALAKNQLSDIIFSYFLEQGLYDIDQINQVLFHYDQALLGGT